MSPVLKSSTANASKRARDYNFVRSDLFVAAESLPSSDVNFSVQKKKKPNDSWLIRNQNCSIENIGESIYDNRGVVFEMSGQIKYYYTGKSIIASKRVNIDINLKFKALSLKINILDKIEDGSIILS